jgi:hypothetical protein
MLKIGYSGLRGTIMGDGRGGSAESAETREVGEMRAWNCGEVVESVERNVRVLLE